VREKIKEDCVLIVMFMKDAFRSRLHIGSHNCSLRHAGEDIARTGRKIFLK
jgi:hypothetical protein